MCKIVKTLTLRRILNIHINYTITRGRKKGKTWELVESNLVTGLIVN